MCTVLYIGIKEGSKGYQMHLKAMEIGVGGPEGVFFFFWNAFDGCAECVYIIQMIMLN